MHLLKIFIQIMISLEFLKYSSGISKDDIFAMYLESSSRTAFLEIAEHCSGGFSFRSKHQNHNLVVCFQAEKSREPISLYVDQSVNEFPVEFYVEYKPSTLALNNDFKVCFALWRVDMNISSYWPPEQFGSWCDNELRSSFVIYGNELGTYRAAVQIRRKEDHLAIFSFDKDIGPVHIIDFNIMQLDVKNVLPKTCNQSVTKFAPTIDFIFGGFPKTGTSTLWFNFGFSHGREVERLIMYSTEPAHWSEINQWRYSFHGANKTQMLGFKSTQFMFDLKWAIGALELNQHAKFVITLRRPSQWLKSFVKYRQYELKQLDGSGRWAAALVDQFPHLLTTTFEHVAYQGVDMLGAHRDRGHFVLWVKPLIDMFGAGANKTLMFVFLEEMSANSRKVHFDVAYFLNMDPSKELPNKFEINNKNEWTSNNLLDDRKEIETVMFLDRFYMNSTLQLNSLLQEYFNIQNIWWNTPI